jgi:hypothetical protein
MKRVSSVIFEEFKKGVTNMAGFPVRTCLFVAVNHPESHPIIIFLS